MSGGVGFSRVEFRRVFLAPPRSGLGPDGGKDGMAVKREFETMTALHAVLLTPLASLPVQGFPAGTIARSAGEGSAGSSVASLFSSAGSVSAQSPPSPGNGWDASAALPDEPDEQPAGQESGQGEMQDESGAWGGMVADIERPSQKGRQARRSGKQTPARSCPTVGGQAVMEGILMRNGGRYAVAVRQKDGSILVERRGWFGLTRRGPLSRPFLRGFPLLVETLVNGIRALNRSAVLAGEDDGKGGAPTRTQLFFTLLAAFGLAALMFVVVPHLLSLGMQALGLGGDMRGFSFHLWDGVFKFAIFIGYIAVISFVPEIRRVFQYHGAEHKVIAALESGEPVSARSAMRHSRLHARCGTTFMLFVLSVAILAHAAAVPPFLALWHPENPVLRHAGVLLFKIALMIPVSSLAYELIRLAARLGSSLWGRILRAPGFLLQLLTTREPEPDQLEVAVVALREALGDMAPENMHTVAYTVLE